MSSQPNILVLMTDQHNANLMGPENPWGVRTPNLDRLAARGANFSRAFCNSPICVPSRMSLMTGLHVHHHGTQDNCASLDPAFPTFAHALTLAGYETTICARMHFNGIDQYHGFERRLVTEMCNPIDYGGPAPDRCQCLAPEYEPPSREHVDMAHRVNPSPTVTYDELVCQRACRYLEKEVPTDRPFMLMASFYGPHPMVSGRPEYESEYLKYLEQDLGARELSAEEFAKLPRHEQRMISGRRDRAQPPSKDKIHRFRAEYFSRVTYTDGLLGRVLDALERSGQADNTVIVYVSDHGEQMGENGHIGKSTYHDFTVRVPLIVSMPDRKASRVDRVVSLVDLMPTLCELAGGVDLGYRVDGQSLMPLVRDPNAPAADEALAEFFDHACWRPNFMLAQGPWKYCHYLGEQEYLINPDLDRSELRNFALEPEHRKRLEAMRARLWELCDPVAAERDARQRQAMRLFIRNTVAASVQTKQRLRDEITAYRQAWNESYWDDNKRQSGHEPFLDWDKHQSG